MAHESTSQGSYTFGHVVWRETMSNDFARSRVFYGELFGWTARDMVMPSGTYTIFSKDGRDIGGGMQMPPGVEAPSHWVSYVSVPDVDGAVRTAQSLGGRSLYEPMNAPGVGRFVALMDPEGAVFAVIRGEKGDAPQPERPGLGTFCWETVVAADLDRAKAFYGKVLGWKPAPGPGGGDDMEVFAAGDVQVADLQVSRGEPSCWMTYVVVQSHAATRDRAAALGGQVIVPSIFVPKVGHIAIVADPTGGVIGLFEPEM